MRLRFFQTIQSRLVLSHLFVSLISVTLISIYAGHVIFNAVRQQIEHRYEDLTFAASNDLEQPLSDYLTGKTDGSEMLQSVKHLLANRPEIHYTIFNTEGVPLADSSGELPPAATPANDPELWEALTDPIGEAEYIRPSPQGDDRIYLAAQIEHDGIIFGVFRMDIPIETALITARRSLTLLVISALLVSLGVSAIGFYLAHNLAEPIQSLTATAENLSFGNMDARAITPVQPQELKRMSDAFNHMAARLQGHVHELRAFVANASHELRTPLTSIKLRVEALQNGALEDPQVRDRFLEEIEMEVDRLSVIVNDMLDLSRMEAGLASNQRSALNLGSLVKEVMDMFQVRAERAEINLEAEIAPDLPEILGNEDQIRRLLANLVDNAIKYTPLKGTVSMILTQGREAGTIRLMVKDTGFGIAKEHLSHIFERFYRVEATRPRYGPPQGSGLGLAIAKSIVETHQGQIGVTSQLGKGTTFWVELPAYQPQPN